MAFPLSTKGKQLDLSYLWLAQYDLFINLKLEENLDRGGKKKNKE